MGDAVINMAITLNEFVSDFAVGLGNVDARLPVAFSSRSTLAYQPGIGPHTEAATVALVMNEVQQIWPERYVLVSREVRYPDDPRKKCDICLGAAPEWDWCIEVKMLRMMGDNGKPNDNMLMHILSPYLSNNSAVTDCEKLAHSQLHGKKAVVIFAYEYSQYPVEPVVRAFELLAADRVSISERARASFSGLVHPVHGCGGVFGWEIDSSRAC